MKPWCGPELRLPVVHICRVLQDLYYLVCDWGLWLKALQLSMHMPPLRAEPRQEANQLRYPPSRAGSWAAVELGTSHRWLW